MPAPAVKPSNYQRALMGLGCITLGALLGVFVLVVVSLAIHGALSVASSAPPAAVSSPVEQGTFTLPQGSRVTVDTPNAAGTTVTRPPEVAPSPTPVPTPAPAVAAPVRPLVINNYLVLPEQSRQNEIEDAPQTSGQYYDDKAAEPTTYMEGVLENHLHGRRYQPRRIIRRR
jgi:hypothetical protein